MLIPPCVLVALGLAAGIAAMIPGFAAALESAAVRFEDQSAYASLVLDGARTASPTALYPAAPADVSVLALTTALCSAAGAVLLALAALYWRRLPLLSPGGATRRGFEPGRGLVVLSQRFQSGIVNDYITWLVVGFAAIGGILALIIR
jgi:hypothetical protein